MAKLRKDEKNTVLTLSLLALGVTLLGWASATPGLVQLVIVLLLLLLLAALVLWRRELIESDEGRFRDLEALQQLTHFLNPVAPLPRQGGYALSPQHALKMVNQLLVSDAQSVVEFGSGVSTLLSAYCMQRRGGGHVLSYESDAFHAEVTRGYLRQHGLEHYATVVDAPLTPFQHRGGTWQWYGIAAHPLPERIDLLFIDGPPRKTCALARYPAVPACLERLAPGAVVLLDDADRPDERAILARWQQEHPGLRLRLPNYDTPNLATLDYNPESPTR